MSLEVNTDFGKLRRCEPDIWLWWCPVCEDWERLSELQMNGELSVDHAATGCPSRYHETHNFAQNICVKIVAYRLAETGDDPVVRS